MEFSPQKIGNSPKISRKSRLVTCEVIPPRSLNTSPLKSYRNPLGKEKGFEFPPFFRGIHWLLNVGGGGGVSTQNFWDPPPTFTSNMFPIFVLSIKFGTRMTWSHPIVFVAFRFIFTDPFMKPHIFLKAIHVYGKHKNQVTIRSIWELCFFPTETNPDFPPMRWTKVSQTTEQ